MDKADEELLRKYKEQRAKQYARQAEYANKTYDRMIVLVQKGRKEQIEAHAKEKGYKSTNAYINALINKDMS